MFYITPIVFFVDATAELNHFLGKKVKDIPHRSKKQLFENK